MKKKGILLLFLSFVLFIKCLIVSADEFIENEPFVDTISNIRVDISSGPPKIDALAGIVMDMKSGRVLYEKDAYIRRPMATIRMLNLIENSI